MAAGIDRTDLIHAAQTGDPAAIAGLLAVCQADARRYAWRHCQASDIDDAVQESLLVIARKVRGLKASSSANA
jgi:DNA-directed RNA polymerase specialized sigma24 family protein